MRQSIIAMLGVGALAVAFLTGMAEQPDKEKGPKKGEQYFLQYRPAIGPDNKICHSPEISFTRSGRKITFHTQIKLK